MRLPEASASSSLAWGQSLRSAVTTGPGATSPTMAGALGSATGRPMVAYNPEYSTAASRKLATGPAATTMVRESTDFSKNARPWRMASWSVGCSCATSTDMPCIFTKPPSGRAHSFQTVS